MRFLKRQFGASFVSALEKSPTLVADLAQCRRKGVRIRKVPGKRQGYSLKSRKLIGIGDRGTRSYKLTVLAHEMFHVLRGTAPIDHVPAGMSRMQFVHLLLEEETSCMVHEAIVIGELIAAGVCVDRECHRWYRLWKRGGRKAIRKRVNELQNSIDDKLYPDYYADIYNEKSGRAANSRSKADR